MTIDALLFKLLRVDNLYDYRCKLELSEQNIPYLVAHYQKEEKSAIEHIKYKFDGKSWRKEECLTNNQNTQKKNSND